MLVGQLAGNVRTRQPPASRFWLAIRLHCQRSHLLISNMSIANIDVQESHLASVASACLFLFELRTNLMRASHLETAACGAFGLRAATNKGPPVAGHEDLACPEPLWWDCYHDGCSVLILVLSVCNDSEIASYDTLDVVRSPSHAVLLLCTSDIPLSDEIRYHYCAARSDPHAYV